MAVTYYRLSDFRSLLQDTLRKPISRHLAWKYSRRSDFPEPIAVVGLEKPERIWDSSMVWQWIEQLAEGLGIRRELEETHTRAADGVDDTVLYAFIKAQGGLRRDPAYWDDGITARENRRKFRYLDRKTGGRAIDDIATEIHSMMPGYGIKDADDLWRWLNG